MRTWIRRHAPWLGLWALLAVAGAAALARLELSHLYAAFDTDARIAHRLLSQRMAQHDAALATLALLQPAPGPEAAERRLPSLYPQVVAVQRRDGAQPWVDPALEAAQAESRRQRRPVPGPLDLAQGRYWLVLAGEPASFALQLSLREAVPAAEWPASAAPVRMTLEMAGQSFLLQPGAAQAGGWRFEATKVLGSASQPFALVASRSVGWGELPWGRMALWALACAGALAVARTLLALREQRRRAEDLLRLGQVGRLNALGELAAGMAHELNQPLTALLANTQAASRLLAEDPPDLATARGAMSQAAGQARRAADVVGRLRRTLEHPDPAVREPVDLEAAARGALHLLAPQLQRHGIEAWVEGPPVRVLAEPVALEQIVHNLVMNAMQALEQVPAGQRRLVLATSQEGGDGRLAVTDTGPGIAPEALPRLFEPFFTTRPGGMGLGLSLCETLAGRLGGRLEAANHAPRGASFRLTLPRATP
ncbi:sensor histidine kinase [Ramlibacter sp. MAHUQ-53]|uniref:sensor histidine kinase n=1 Tax=unclassified Ramlibacter TaxID=2617605 RepID=UPI0036345B49